MDQTIPPEDIEVRQAIQMSQINLSGERIDEVVLNEDGVPGANEVGGEDPTRRLPYNPRNLSKL